MEDKEKRLKKATDRMEQHIVDSTTGWPRPSGLEAMIRQIQIGLMKGEIMIIAMDIKDGVVSNAALTRASDDRAKG
jgi:hypothetical protein